MLAHRAPRTIALRLGLPGPWGPGTPHKPPPPHPGSGHARLAPLATPPPPRSWHLAPHLRGRKTEGPKALCWKQSHREPQGEGRGEGADCIAPGNHTSLRVQSILRRSRDATPEARRGNLYRPASGANALSAGGACPLPPVGSPKGHGSPAQQVAEPQPPNGQPEGKRASHLRVAPLPRPHCESRPTCERRCAPRLVFLLCRAA